MQAKQILGCNSRLGGIVKAALEKLSAGEKVDPGKPYLTPEELNYISETSRKLKELSSKGEFSNEFYDSVAPEINKIYDEIGAGCDELNTLIEELEKARLEYSKRLLSEPLSVPKEKELQLAMIWIASRSEYAARMDPDPEKKKHASELLRSIGQASKALVEKDNFHSTYINYFRRFAPDDFLEWATTSFDPTKIKSMSRSPLSMKTTLVNVIGQITRVPDVLSKGNEYTYEQQNQASYAIYQRLLRTLFSSYQSKGRRPRQIFPGALQITYFTTISNRHAALPGLDLPSLPKNTDNNRSQIILKSDDQFFVVPYTEELKNIIKTTVVISNLSISGLLPHNISADNVPDPNLRQKFLSINMQQLRERVLQYEHPTIGKIFPEEEQKVQAIIDQLVQSQGTLLWDGKS